MQQRFWFLKEP